MEEILASIRRIIADDEASKRPPKAADPMPLTVAPLAQPPRPAAPPSRRPPTPPPPVAELAPQPHDLNSMLGDLDKGSVLQKPDADVPDLTEARAASAPGAQPDTAFGGVSAVAALRSEPVAGERPLMSSATSAAVDSAFNTLAHTVLVQNARTLEDLVREMLRPLLKTWLDDNLPGLVERLVRAEIERVSRGRG